MSDFNDMMGYQSPFGNESVFHDPMDNYITSPHTDFIRLIKFIKDNKYRDRFYKEPFIGDSGDIRIGEEKPIIDKSKEEDQGALKLEAMQCKNSGTISFNPSKAGLEFILDKFNKKIAYHIHFYFKGKNPVYLKDNKNNEIAISISTKSFIDFDLLEEHIGLQFKTAEFLEIIIKKFQRTFREIDSGKELDWLYERTPDFVVKEHSKELLWTHFIKLLAFDKSKWFIDSSTAMVKVLRGIIAQDNGMRFLYNKFEANPNLIKRIYYSLDKSGKSSYHDNKVVPNKTIFASLLTTIAFYEGQGLTRSHRKTGITFTIGKNYRVDSNIRMGNDSSESAYDLRQERLVTRTRIRNIGGFGYEDGSISQQYGPAEKSSWQYEGEIHTLHPLDIVTLLFEGDKGVSIPYFLPVIMLKDIAHLREWEKINERIRLGANILAIILGAAALVTSGNPGVLALAIADIGLAGRDIYIQLRKDEYMKTIKGQKFLQDWEAIYIIGGIGIAVISAPQLVRSALSLGAGLYRFAEGTTKNFLRHALISIIVRLDSIDVVKSGIKNVDIGVEVFKDTILKSGVTALNRLEKEGVLFVRLEDVDGLRTYTAIYNGVAIVPRGSAKELKKSLKGVWNKRGKSLTNELEEIVRVVKKNTDGNRSAGHNLSSMDSFRMKQWINYLERRGVDVQVGTPHAKKKLTEEGAYGLTLYDLNTVTGKRFNIRVLFDDNPSLITFYEETIHALQAIKGIDPVIPVVAWNDFLYFNVDAYEFYAKTWIYDRPKKLKLTSYDEDFLEASIYKVVTGDYF